MTRRSRHDHDHRWRRDVPLAAGVAGLGVAAVLGFVLLGRIVDRSFRYFSKEPAETFQAPVYVGWAAHGTTLIWSIGAVCALLVGVVLRSIPAERERSSFLLSGGLLTALMVVDDMFLLHDGVYARASIPEELLYAAYGIAAAAIGWRFRRVILESHPLLLVAAVLAWGGSVASDFVQETTGRHLHVWEDGSKLVGVMLWSAFFARTGVSWLRDLAKPGVSAAEPH